MSYHHISCIILYFGMRCLRKSMLSIINILKTEYISRLVESLHAASSGEDPEIQQVISEAQCLLPNTQNKYVGFTLSYATKALRESRGTALLYF